TVAGILTVAVSLSLFGGILLLSKWVDHGTERIKGGVTLEIFMNVNATDSQVNDIRHQLEHDPQVKAFRFLNHDDAFKDYKQIFNNDANLVGSITPADLPESFRVAPKRAELTETVRQEYRTQQGVNDVATPGDALKTILDVTNKIRYGFYAVIIIL